MLVSCSAPKLLGVKVCPDHVLRASEGQPRENGSQAGSVLLFIIMTIVNSGISSAVNSGVKSFPAFPSTQLSSATQVELLSTRHV